MGPTADRKPKLNVLTQLPRAYAVMNVCCLAANRGRLIPNQLNLVIQQLCRAFCGTMMERGSLAYGIINTDRRWILLCTKFLTLPIFPAFTSQCSDISQKLMSRTAATNNFMVEKFTWVTATFLWLRKWATTTRTDALQVWCDTMGI